ncbi:ribonuclease T2 family protein [Halomonas sp. ML-15]|uniref:ribonuclease T2 family protein n=1 Tax=Halomonas sp. ML-15 TaxID=2773305 RepID=UPI002964B463|nr:ribonuclease I [Halomonas sp. ML-15]
MRRCLVSFALVLLGVWVNLAAADTQPLEGEGFDHYTLALTWHPGFCETHSRPPDECRERQAGQGFVLHGLWPSLPERFARDGVDRPQWWREGCFLEEPRAAGSFCRAHPPFDLPEALGKALDEGMPGRASCLDRYQYAKHAACLALDADDYFAASLQLLERVNASAFADYVVLNQGGEVDRNELIGAFEAAFGSGNGRALRLECRGPGNRQLSEVRIGIGVDRLGDFPDAESLVEQRPGRCHNRVQIPAAG